MRGSSKLEISLDREFVQQIDPPNNLERFEGIDFSPSGNILAVATADTNAVLLFRRKPDGRFENSPFGRIDGTASKLNYPHDVSFGMCGNSEMLAVAQRRGTIAIFKKDNAGEFYSVEPTVEISGPKSELDYSDAVAFVPPDNRYLAACCLTLGTIAFFRRKSGSEIKFSLKPRFTLKHSSLNNPDGLTFSRCGKWLAVANHGGNSVSIFQRQSRILSGGKLKYGPEPVTVIEDRQLRYPHSVAFTPRSAHLVVTSAGANHLSVYQPKRRNFRTRWSQYPVLRVAIGNEDAFREVNFSNKMEGGPKGIAIYDNIIAVCSPEIGIKILPFRGG